MSTQFIVRTELKVRVKFDYQTQGQFTFMVISDSASEAKADAELHMESCEGWKDEQTQVHQYDKRKTAARLAEGPELIIGGEACDFCLRHNSIMLFQD